MRNILPADFQTALNEYRNNSTVAFIDVCSPAEHLDNHIHDTINIPLDQLAIRQTEISGKQTVYVYCRSGNRSRVAADLLEHLFPGIIAVNLDGGILAWEDAGLPTIRYGQVSNQQSLA